MSVKEFWIEDGDGVLKHEQVSREIISDLLDAEAHGGLQAGKPLPSETQLAERFSVSVPTVRRALAALAEAGVVVRRHGAGTFLTDAAADRARTFRSPLERLFTEAAQNAESTAVNLDGVPVFHPQGPLGAAERFTGNRAVRDREAAHYELLGRVMGLLRFYKLADLSSWLGPGRKGVNLEWSGDAPTLDDALLELVPRMPHNDGGIPGLRVLRRSDGRADLFWIMHDPPVSLSLRVRE